MKTDEPYHVFSRILISLTSQKNSELLFTLTLASNCMGSETFFLETEYAALISIYHSLGNTKKCNFKALFLYSRSRVSDLCTVEAELVKVTVVKNLLCFKTK